jgi:hypothetical protein
MRIFVTSVLITLALAAPAVAGDIYKSVNAQGVVTYSDTPPYPGAKPLDIRSRPTDPDVVAAERAELMGTRGEQSPPEQAEAAPDTEAQAAQRAEQCRLARERAAKYANAQRLYEPLPDGGRRYLTDEELDQARDEARQAIVRFCED